jgi:ABC-type sulfate/molybdate transport systems ATPase subunit
MKLFVDIRKRLSGFNLDIKFEMDNDILGLLGESGSGKSMTLKCIAGLEKPDSGKIILNDRVLFDSERGIYIPIKDRRVGFLFQNYALFPHMTVEQNIGYGLSSLKKEERNRIIRDKIQMMQLEGLEKRYPGQISGGQQQRVALARALVVEPEVLLLDEPFSALDNHLRRQMIIQMSETLSQYKGYTLFVTHNMEEAFQLCDNLLIISDGKKIEHDNKNKIFKAPSTVAAARLTGCKNITSVKVIGTNFLEAEEWGCKLKINRSDLSTITHVGIRAHYIQINGTQTDNTFEGWPAYVGDNPFTKIIYLKLNNPPLGNWDHTLQCEVSLETWEQLSSIPTPWKVNLDIEKLLLLRTF